MPRRGEPGTGAGPPFPPVPASGYPDSAALVIDPPERLFHPVRHPRLHLDITPFVLNIDTAEADISGAGSLIDKTDELRGQHGLSAPQIDSQAHHTAGLTPAAIRRPGIQIRRVPIILEKPAELRGDEPLEQVFPVVGIELRPDILDTAGQHPLVRLGGENTLHEMIETHLTDILGTGNPKNLDFSAQFPLDSFDLEALSQMNQRE